MPFTALPTERTDTDGVPVRDVEFVLLTLALMGLLVLCAKGAERL